MKLAKYLNPTSFIGQLAVYVCAFLAGALFWQYIQPPCPPSTSIHNDITNKSKRGSTSTLGVGVSTESSDCIEWLKSLSMKEIRGLR